VPANGCEADVLTPPSEKAAVVLVGWANACAPKENPVEQAAGAG